MEKEVKCGICGKVFVTDKPNKKYCSFVCRESAIKLKRLSWKTNNPEYYKNYFRQIRAKDKKAN